VIRIGLSRPRNSYDLLSWAVRAVTGRPYSHVGIILDGEDAVRGLSVVLEASNVGVRFVPLQDYALANILVKTITPSRPIGLGVDAMISSLGIRYDALGLVGEGWVVACQRWLHKAVRNPLRSPHAMWCSELVALVLRAAGYPGAMALDPFSAAPADIDDLLSTRIP
jgi:hypothetical protein